MKYYHAVHPSNSPEPLGEDDPVARERLVALSEQDGSVYVYMPETRMWHYSWVAEEHLCARAGSGHRLRFSELGPDEVYELVALVVTGDRRTRGARLLEERLECQLRRSGEVLTSAEVGLLTGWLPHRLVVGNQVRSLVEARSGRKRWTALYAYPETSTTPRSVARWLRGCEPLAHTSEGRRLVVQHKRRTLTVGGAGGKRRLVEAKYVPEGARSDVLGEDENGIDGEPSNGAEMGASRVLSEAMIGDRGGRRER